MFSCDSGELVGTLDALEYLKRPEAILAPSFLDAEFGTAPGAGGV
jgi:hypothetical protein